MKNLLFVCTGNICRSPTAEGVFRHLITQQGLTHLFAHDSAGTQSYHVGEQADARSRAAAKQRGILFDDLTARRLRMDDFHEFDYIFAMDKSHHHWMTQLKPKGAKAEVHLYLPYCDIIDPLEVPDPYYGKEDGFEYVLDLIEQASRNLITKLTRP